MKFIHIIFLLFAPLVMAQQQANQVLLNIRNEGFGNSKAMPMLSTLTDKFGPRLTGSRGYLAAAKWMAQQMESIGLDNVKLEPSCKDCRGWSIKSFNVELIAPNYMNIVAYPLAMTKSTNGQVKGDVVHIKRWWELDKVKTKFTGKLKGKIILMGYPKRTTHLNTALQKRYSSAELQSFEKILKPKNQTEYLPDMVDDWLISDRDDQGFFEFIEKEGALAVLTTNESPPGLLRVEKSFYFLNKDYKLPAFFSIIPEHFGRLSRLVEQGIPATIRLNLETEFYTEPENNVNIIGEISGNDPELKSEVVLVGGHFDSWHASTGATDNAANAIVLVEALRILKAIGFRPKRTIRIGLWDGEEQAFYGSLAYADKHYGQLTNRPNPESKKVSVYLNLDNGAGSIQGIYLQGNVYARPVFQSIFQAISDITEGVTSIENQPSTDHIVFDHYNIPAFQFIQDPLAFYSMTLHTNMDVYEYVSEEDVLKNAVIMAWTIYALSEQEKMVPRKIKK